MPKPSFVLTNGFFLINGSFEQRDVRIERGMISEIGGLRPKKNETVFSLSGRYVVPAFINSHDHLEFNLFPPLGKPPYRNYVDWGTDLQKHYQAEIGRVLRIPLGTRLLWGAYKNILSGVTTVVHHNPYYFHFHFGFPVQVFRNYTWIHSLEFDKSFRQKLNHARHRTLIIHAAEGVDELAAQEVGKLAAFGALSSRTVLVHGVGITDGDIELLHNSRCSLVWCPGSNHFLFQKTAPIDKLFGKVPIALGTDSTLTGGDSMFEELRKARASSGRTPLELLNMATSTPARMFGMNKGEIRVGTEADLLVFERRSDNPLESLFDLSPAGVKCLLKSGRPLLSTVDSEQLFNLSRQRHSRIVLGNDESLVVGDLPRLKARINRFIPDSEFNHFGIEPFAKEEV